MILTFLIFRSLLKFFVNNPHCKRLHFGQLAKPFSFFLVQANAFPSILHKKLSFTYAISTPTKVSGMLETDFKSLEEAQLHKQWIKKESQDSGEFWVNLMAQNNGFDGIEEVARF